MPSFPFHDLRPFEGKSAAIKRPREITEFSFDDEHKSFPLDSRSLRYHYPPFFDPPAVEERNRVDLSQGFDTFIKYDDTAQNLHLDPLLETTQAHEEQTKTKVDADILTWRGMMTKILAAPFDYFGEFEMIATWYQGTIYIEENQGAKIAQQQQQPAKQHRKQHGPSPEMMQYWGYKFETLSTLPKPWSDCSRSEIENRTTEIVNNNAQYCSIVRTCIGNHTLIIGGEVDAVLGSKPSNPDDQIPYVELKTSENFNHNDQHSALKLERKMCRMWAQSFLLGVPKIIIGFRTKDGMLVRIEEFKTLEIPNMVKHRGQRSWDGNVCINFAAQFLDFLKREINGEGTWRISQKKGAKEILVERVSEQSDPEVVSARFREHRESFTFDGS